MKLSEILILGILFLVLGMNSSVFADPCINLKVSADPNYVQIGDEIYYDVNVSNCGETPVSLFEVYSSLLGDITLKFPPELPPATSIVVNFQYEILPDDPNIIISDPDIIIHYVSVLGIDESGSPVEDFNDSVVFLVDPNIDIEKTVVDEPNACPGDTITYYICIENTGDWPLEYVEVHDPNLCPIYGCPLPGYPSILSPGEIGCNLFDYTIPPDANVPYCGEGVFENWAEVTANPAGFPYVIDANDYVTICCPPPLPGGEGCVPGFWKTNASKHGASAWCGRFSPDDPFSTHFSLIEPLVIKGKGKETITNPVLLQALEANGGGVNAMIRQGIAAILNACSDCVNYEISSPDQVIRMIEDTLNGAPGACTVDELYNMFAQWNEAGCSVNQHGDCVDLEEQIDGF